MNSDYVGDSDCFAFGSQPITKCALPVTFANEVDGKDTFKPNIARIQGARKNLKSWRALGIHPNVIFGIENSGYKRPLPMERVAITMVQEGVSAIISGSSGKSRRSSLP